ncbi:MAG: prolipoprotein diacylglyceryl transferase [Planctomycetes bacterium]|nr:prolipoprotein diacylglyceryl transferase [Planctomycetota bacterium]
MRRRIVEIALGKLTIPINSYGLMMAIGFLLGIYFASRRAEREDFDSDVIIDVGWIAIIAGILGARLLFVLQNYRTFLKRPLDIFRVDQGGLVFYGGFIAATICVSVYMRKKGLSIAKVLDMVTPSLAMGLAFTRIGCFLNGCCWGDICRHPNIFPAVRFPAGSFAYAQHVSLGLIGPTDLASLPVHPTELYSSVCAFLLFVLISYLYRFKKRDGEVLATFAVLYSVTRFMLEFWRADNPPVVDWFKEWARRNRVDNLPPFWEGPTISQCISVAVFVLALVWIIYGRLKARRKQAVPGK